MIQLQQKQMDEGVYYVEVLHETPIVEDIRVFFEGDYDCLTTYLLELGMKEKEIEIILEEFDKVGL